MATKSPYLHRSTDDAVVEVLRGLARGERLAIANRMWVSARQVVGFMVRCNHPDWSDEHVQHEIVRRMLHLSCFRSLTKFASGREFGMRLWDRWRRSFMESRVLGTTSIFSLI